MAGNFWTRSEASKLTVNGVLAYDNSIISVKESTRKDDIKMKCKKTLIAAGAIAAMTVFSPAVLPVEYAQEAGVNQCLAKTYKNGSYVLNIPGKYDNQVDTKILKTDPYGKLFTVSELASIEAAKAKNYETDGIGWLFAIGVLGEDKIGTMLCGDMSGVEVFARDGQWNYYLLYHPTDVRYFRENESAMRRDEKKWRTLTEWVGTSVAQDFIKDNPGLVPVSFDNSEIGIRLARIMFKQDTYTISTNEFGPLNPNGVNPTPYVDTLIKDARYEYADIKDTPDGEYVVLSFPKEGVRFDFFLQTGHRNYVREVRSDGSEILYKATFKNSTIEASDIMNRWYHELAANRAE